MRLSAELICKRGGGHVGFQVEGYQVLGVQSTNFRPEKLEYTFVMKGCGLASVELKCRPPSQ